MAGQRRERRITRERKGRLRVERKGEGWGGASRSRMKRLAAGQGGAWHGRVREGDLSAGRGG